MTIPTVTNAHGLRLASISLVSADWLCRALGFISTLIVMLPYLGRLGGVPFRIFTPAFTIIYVALLILGRHAIKRMKIQLAIFNFLLLLLIVMISLSATSSQVQYLWSISHWINSPKEYYDSILILFLIGAIPAAFITVSASVLNISGRYNFLNGVVMGFIFLGILSSLKILLDSEIIFTNNLAKALSYFANDPPIMRNFSTVSFGAILSASSVAALWYLHGKTYSVLISSALSAIFLCGLFSINQRSNFIFSSITVITILATLWWRAPEKKNIFLASALILIAVPTFVVLCASPIHTTYWSEFGQAIEARVDMVCRAFRYTDEQETVKTLAPASGEALLRAAGGETTIHSNCLDRYSEYSVEPKEANAFRDDDEQSNSVRENSVTSVPIRGLGAYAFIDTQLLYPHNILAELWIEVGIVSAIVAAFLILGWAYYSIRHASEQETSQTLSISAIGLVLLLHAMKAGNLSFFGPMIFALWFVWAWPVAADSSKFHVLIRRVNRFRI